MQTHAVELLRLIRLSDELHRTQHVWHKRLQGPSNVEISLEVSMRDLWTTHDGRLDSRSLLNCPPSAIGSLDNGSGVRSTKQNDAYILPVSRDVLSLEHLLRVHNADPGLRTSDCRLRFPLLPVLGRGLCLVVVFSR